MQQTLRKLTRRFSTLTHVDSKTNLPKMVNISKKVATTRTATAESIVYLPPSVRSAAWANDDNEHDIKEFQSPKGPVIATSIIAGVMAAKRTSELIPFCHPIMIEDCSIKILPTHHHHPHNLTIRCTVVVNEKTGVEMEALTGATVAALTLYDMCKAMSSDIKILETKLVSKTGGKTDFTI